MQSYQRSKVLPFELGATLVGGQKGRNECPQKIVPVATHIPRGVPKVHLRRVYKGKENKSHQQQT